MAAVCLSPRVALYVTTNVRSIRAENASTRLHFVAERLLQRRALHDNRPICRANFREGVCTSDMWANLASNVWDEMINRVLRKIHLDKDLSFPFRLSNIFDNSKGMYLYIMKH